MRHWPGARRDCVQCAAVHLHWAAQRKDVTDVARNLEIYDAIPESAVIIVAHPDDAEFGVAGTVARWARGGARVVYLLATDGDKGSEDPSIRSEELAALRRAEQQAACAILGVETVEFLHYADGYLEPSLALRRDMARMIRKHKPKVAICQDPTRFFHGRGYINHPDHRAAGEAALGAIFPAARDRLTFPELFAEGFEPHKVDEVFVGMAENDDVIIDISATFEAKIQALRAHKSQMGDWDPTEMVDKWARENAEGFDFSHGESFRYFKLGGD
jgi:LmbE family N-acetylglucosaminyl deacetylase